MLYQQESDGKRVQVSRLRFPLHCLTKSELILRDLDLLGEIDKRAILPADLRNKVNGGVLITISNPL